jgi:FkbM family methyltransferase
MIKKILKTIFEKFGYEIKKKDAHGFNAGYLSRICSPKTVFDVGIGYGTHELYKAYPKADFFLVEPLKEFKSVLEEISTKVNSKIYYKALGDTIGIKEINVEANPELSSLKERPKRDVPSKKRKVDVTTFDAILKENLNIESPILIKIDTEGCELEVLKGAENLLELTDIVIAEVSISKRFENSYAFEDLIIFMKEKNFIVFDFLTVCPCGGKPGTNLVDIVFKKTSVDN